MKAYDAVCGHKKYNDDSKTYWKKTHTVLVPDDAAALMESNGGKIMIMPNDLPGVTYFVSFKKFEEREDSKY